MTLTHIPPWQNKLSSLEVKYVQKEGWCPTLMAGRKVTCVGGNQVQPRLTEAFLSSRVQVRGRDRHPTCRSIRAVGSLIFTPLSLS